MTTTLLLQLAVIFGVLFLTMFLRFPFFLSCFASAAAYAIIWPGAMPAFVFGQTFVQGLGNQTYAAVIFYLFLGQIMVSGGIGDRLVEFLNSILGPFKGSLSHINVLDSMIFAGVSGSAVADTASIGGMMIPIMKKQGYGAAYAAAITQMTSIIGPIIPPSTTFVLIASMLDLSVRKLFLSGLVPGIAMGLLMLAYSIFISYKRNYPSSPFAGWKKVWELFKLNFWALLLPGALIFMLSAGIGTVTEIGALACVFALFISIVVYKEMDFKGFIKAMMGTARQIATVLSMLAAASVFTWIIGSMNFSPKLAVFMASTGLSGTAMFLLAMLIIFLLGMILETSIITLVFFPVLATPIVQAGIDPYVFAVAAAITCAIGLNTPPVGTLLYMTARFAEADALEVAKESLPFIAVLILLVILMAFFPEIVTFYPSLVM